MATNKVSPAVKDETSPSRESWPNRAIWVDVYSTGIGHLTEYLKRHRSVAYFALTCVLCWALGIPLQASTSNPPLSPTAANPGIIAYVRRSTHDIHLISPDGTGDRVLWTAPRPLALQAAHDIRFLVVQRSTRGNTNSGQRQ